MDSDDRTIREPESGIGGPTPSEPADPPHVIRPDRPERALPWLAALSSARIPHRVEDRDGSWCIVVPARCATAARAELAEYERVNRDWPPAPSPAYEEAPPASPAVVLAAGSLALVLVKAFLQIGPADAGNPWASAGALDSLAVRSGEWWRLGTALGLHADLPHVLGNAVCLFFLGIGAGQLAGPGLGWLLIVAAGWLGNAGTAFLVRPEYTSVGASTASFGALGILTSLQFVREYRRTGSLRGVWARPWIPPLAGAALLSFLGTGPRADISSHVFGFLAGVGLGLGCARRFRAAASSLGLQLAAAVPAAALSFVPWLFLGRKL